MGKKVLEDVGVELIEYDEFSCCPEPVGFGLNDKLTWISIAARNIAISEENGHELLTLCNGCYYTLKQADVALKASEELRDKVNGILSETDHKYRGTTEVKHFVHVLLDDIGLDRVKRKVEVPLGELKVACHPGCHIISPMKVFRFDDHYDPVILESMVSTLGASISDYDLKPLCCGWTLTNYGTRESASKLLGDKLRSMREANADCIAVTCPQCFYQFDTGQVVASRALKLEFGLPVLFYLQLLGLSFGYSLDEVLYGHHRVRSKAFEEKIRRMLY